jgi:MYXO-CTERM domain-containing protein
MAKKPKDPWSDDQLQSTPGGPPDTTPWKLTVAVIAMLALLMLGGYLLWRQPPEAVPASPPTSVR